MNRTSGLRTKSTAPESIRAFASTVRLLALSGFGLLLLLPRADAMPAGQEESQELGELRQRVVELEAALDSLRSEYGTRLAAFEEKLASIDVSAQPTMTAADQAKEQEEEALSEQERAALEEELAAILGEVKSEEASAGASTAAAGQEELGTTPQKVFTGRTRTLNQLNPEISVTGDVFGTFSDGAPEGDQFRFAEFELAFQAPLDPFSLAKAFVVQEDGEFELEEGYIEWPALPKSIGAKFGAYRNDFGKLNRWHQHALPQSDRPLVHQAIFGEDGLRGLGASVSWLPPAFLGNYNELWFQVTNDDNDVAFSGRGFDGPVFTLHETNYWDLSSATYFEFGLSASLGHNDELAELQTQVYGVDWTLNWAPPARALYRGLEVRGEFLWERREEQKGAFDDFLGAYTYATYKLSRRGFLGLRADWTQLPELPGEEVWGLSPYVEWWQSEWVRFRFQYSYSSRAIEEAPEELESLKGENRFFFQVTWSIGPHKHERY